MKKKTYPALILLLFSCLFFAELNAQQTYSKVSIRPLSQNIMDQLVALGMTIDHAEVGPDASFSFYVTQTELATLQQNAIAFTVEIEDYALYYRHQSNLDRMNGNVPTRTPNVAQGFDLGSMGGFYTWDEVAAKLDEMKTEYPNLITAKTSIGTSVEGREIWMAKISDNPDIDENEPVAYYDGLHHAREPLSMATTLNYMFWLLENYEADPMVKYLVDHRELYFVPVVNPDGYEYNRQTNPEGGGLWRKNRNPNDGNCFGVDLNRNYSFAFANNNDCSSPDPCSGVYRGEGAFSEPETAAVRDFLLDVAPKTAFSTHSTAGSYLMPYGFDTSPPEFDIYSEWASAFLSENDYPYGVTFQMLGYTSCGTTRDFMLSEGIYGWTPEIDGAGFWPPESSIFDLVGENVYPLFYNSWVAGAFVDVQSHQMMGDAMPGGSFSLEVEVKNIGVGGTAENVSVVLEASVPGVTVSGPVLYGDIPMRSRADNQSEPFTISLASDFEESSFGIKIYTYQSGVINEVREIPFYVGEKEVLFQDDASAGAGQWTASGDGIPWSEVTDDAYSGSVCFGDSNGGNGLNNTLNYFELNPDFDFSSAITPAASFMAKYSLETGDVVSFQISVDGGGNWETLGAFTQNETWRSYFFNLANFVGEGAVTFRFVMDTDPALPGDGFYFDDFEISNYNEVFLASDPLLMNFGITIVPNPFKNTLMIDLQGETMDGIAEISLFDIQGRLLRNAQNSERSRWELSNLDGLGSGVYFLNLRSTGGKVFVKKVMKL